MLHKFANIKKQLISCNHDYSIILVANVREKTTGFQDYQGTSVISEFLTLAQYELIIETIRNIGFEVTSYFDENEFIKDCISNNYFKNIRKQVIVINTAQKGTAVGRKSLIPAFCDLNGLWHSNSNAYIVSLTRNKYHCDSILKANGFPVTEEYWYFPETGWFLGQHPVIGEKVIAKLNGETSSIGMSTDNIFEYDITKDAFIKNMALSYNQPVIIQSFIEGFEVEVPIIIDGNACEIVLPVGISVDDNMCLKEVILDYETRKNLKFGFYNYEAFNKNISSKLESCSKDVIKLLGIEGCRRVAYRIDMEGKYYITDIAANPHLTKGMSFNYAFEENGMDYQEMLETLIALTISRYKRRLI